MACCWWASQALIPYRIFRKRGECLRCRLAADRDEAHMNVEVAIEQCPRFDSARKFALRYDLMV